MAFIDLRGVSFWTIVRHTVTDFVDDELSTYASALAYRGLFAMFPFLVFLIALLGFLDLQNFFDWLRMQAELALPPVKIHCSILAEDAIKAAVRDYKQKKGLL